MKYISSKLIHKAKGRKRGKYLITLEVTDYDIEMFEEFGYYPTAEVTHSYGHNHNAKYTRMERYLRKVVFYGTFHKLWRKYDSCELTD